jgi:signal transduction histidine kinase
MIPTLAMPITSKPQRPFSLTAPPLPAEKKKSNHAGGSINTMAHEIRNPLTNINLAIEVLKDCARNEEEKAYLDIIKRSSARINDIVSLLLHSQNGNGVERNLNSVHTLLEEVLLMNMDRIRLKNILICRNYSTRYCVIKSNPAEFKIALTNIIINAIEAIPAKKRGQIEIVTKILNGICFIIIKDNGTGISKQNLKKLFQPYFTLKNNGVGLGLSVTLSILNSNNIKINVRSMMGKGTRFILSYNNEI